MKASNITYNFHEESDVCVMRTFICVRKGTLINNNVKNKLLLIIINYNNYCAEDSTKSRDQRSRIRAIDRDLEPRIDGESGLFDQVARRIPALPANFLQPYISQI